MCVKSEALTMGLGIAIAEERRRESIVKFYSTRVMGGYIVE